MQGIESLANLTTLSTSGGPSSARSYVNPFIMPKGSDRFQYREEENRKQKEQLAAVHKMTLVQRADMQTPKIPSLVTTATVKVREPSSARSGAAPRSNEVRPVPPEAPNTGKNMRMTEFVAQKREIFLVQLLIERKNKEMHRLDNEMRAEEKSLLDTENALAEASNQYKMATAQAEAALARARKASEAATKKRVELQKEYKLLLQTTSITRAEITKNEDTLEAHRRYYEFLKSITRDGHSMEEFYESPKVLEAEFDAMEKQNLFLIEQFQELEQDIEKGVNREHTILADTIAQIESVQKKLGVVPVVKDEPYTLTEADLREAENVESELKALNALILKTFVKCFGAGGDISTMGMLERIENALEDMYVKIEYVNPAFVEQKQKKKDYERGEQRRKEEAERKEAEQRLKVQQALERATRPIKKRTGRPMVRRVLPIKETRTDEAALRAAMLEQQRINDLLYGEDLD